MLTIAKLFGKSPFSPLQSHMKKVSMCIKELPLLLEAIESQDQSQIENHVKKISKLEHEADLTKNDIRNHLPKSLFLPIERSTLLEILSLQDSLADKAEDIGVVITLHPLTCYDLLKTDFIDFYKGNIEAFFLAKKIIEEIDELLESSFGGIEAQKVKEMVDQVSLKEHELALMQHQLLKRLYSLGEKMDYPAFHLWVTLVKEIGSISDLSEKLANRIRMVLEIK